MNTETPDAPEIPSLDDDLHEALSLSICAILRMHFSASKRIDAEQNAELKRRLADGSGKVALFVTHDGKNAEARLALIDAKATEVFTNYLLTLQGPLLSAIAPADAVKVINRLKLN